MMFLCMGVLLIVAKYLLTDATRGSTDSMFLRLYNKDSSYLDVNVRNVEELVPQLRSNETLVMYIHGFKENVDYAGPKLVSEAPTKILDNFSIKRYMKMLKDVQIVRSINSVIHFVVETAVQLEFAMHFNSTCRKVEDLLLGDSSSWNNQAASPYLKYATENIIAIDYREIANMSYLSAVSLVDTVGATVANALDTIVASVANATDVHLIGHSLGSQVAGSVARHTNFRVSRITGLDPAGPLFYVLNTHLTAKDADFVDIIHTDMGIYGLALSTGHVDFFPNNAVRPQPGCALYGPILSETELCSHHRSYVFYAESVGNNEFIGASCSRSLVFFPGECNQTETAVMGYGTSPDTRGNYFFKTYAESPYAQGLNGIQGFPEIDAV